MSTTSEPADVPETESESTAGKDGAAVASIQKFDLIDWKRLSYCPYCKEVQNKWNQHVVSEHEEEEEVAAFLAEKLERKKTFLRRMLQNRSNYAYNAEVLKKGEGELIVNYKAFTAKRKVTGGDYSPCSKCFMYFHKSKFEGHDCPMNWIMPDPDGPLAPPDAALSEKLDAAIHLIKEKDLKSVLKGDVTIMGYGRALLLETNYGLANYVVRQKLTLIGQLLISVRQRTGLDSLSLAEAFNSEYFPAITTAVREHTMTDGVRNETTFRLLMKAINKCAAICKAACMQKGAVSDAKTYNKFLEYSSLQL